VAKKRAPRKASFSVASRVKDYVRDRGYCAGADLPDAVSLKVKEMLDAGIRRTESNGRRTVRSEDL
jgi:hypothetical protein